MKHFFFRHLRTAAASTLLFVSFVVMSPVAEAADVGPICVLLLKTESGSIVTTGATDVMLNKGDDLEMYWFSGNATRAENTSGEEVSLSGKATVSPQKNTTYTYTFSKERKQMECSVTVSPVEVEITSSTLFTKDSTPTISGTAKNTKTVSFEIFKFGIKNPVYKSGVIKVIDSAWKETVSSSLAKGGYTLVLSGSSDLHLRRISSNNLTIGTTVSTDTSGVVVVQSIPLLLGGAAKRNQTVGVSYLQVLNVSLKPVIVTGIRVKQAGTASPDVVQTLSAIDDTELHKGQVGKIGVSPFKSNEAVIPISVTIQPKEVRLFTLKALLANNVSDYFGDTLKLQISGVESRSLVKGTFPIPGVTWTIGL